MKSLITYYSYSGNTDKAANICAEILKNKSEVDIQRLRPKDEVNTFFGQCKAARLHEHPELEGNIKFDATPYSLILIGSPVWAFAPAPAVNTYIDKISGIKGKKVIVLLTSGSGLGVKNAFKNIRTALEAKGAIKIEEINIPDRKQGDRDFIISSVEKAL